MKCAFIRNNWCLIGRLYIIRANWPYEGHLWYWESTLLPRLGAFSGDGAYDVGERVISRALRAMWRRMRRLLLSRARHFIIYCVFERYYTSNIFKIWRARYITQWPSIHITSWHISPTVTICGARCRISWKLAVNRVIASSNRRNHSSW